MEKGHTKEHLCLFLEPQILEMRYKCKMMLGKGHRIFLGLLTPTTHYLGTPPGTKTPVFFMKFINGLSLLSPFYIWY